MAGRGLLATLAELGWYAWQAQRDRRREEAADPTIAIQPWANARMVAFCYDQRAAEIRDHAFDLAADGNLDAAADWEQAADEWTAAAAQWRAWADSL